MPDVWPKGTYWIRVVPEDADGPIVDLYPCNTANEYWFEIIVDQTRGRVPILAGAAALLTD